MKKSTTKTSGISRRDFLVTGSGLVLGATMPLGCGGGGEDGGGGAAADPAAAGTPWAGTDKIVDMIESVHLADVDHYGQFVDFGNASRFKYTLGGWMSGWDNDTSMNGTAFTWATKNPARFYFTTLEKTPLTFVIRTKKGGTDSFGVYLNDKPLDRVRFKSDDWEEHRVTATEEAVLVGENYLKFVFRTAERKIAGSNASFMIDYIRIVPDGGDAPSGVNFDPPHHARMKQRYKAGDKERESLVLSLPSTLSYYAEVPKDASLCLAGTTVPSSGAQKTPEAGLRVRATPVDGGEPVQLIEASFSPGSWQEKMADLKGLAGKLVRIDLAASGTAGERVAIGDLAIRLRQPRIEAAGKKIKNAVVVLIDTLRADKLTAYSKTRVKTPAFDKFVAESTLFEHCQAPSNWTKPSCATVLTGLHPDTHRARGHGSRLPKSVKLASDIYRSSGYATGAFIANGYLAAEFGFKRGWTEYVNFIRENKNTDAENVYKKSLDFISTHKDKPFFTYIQTIDPHVPYDPPPEDLKLYDAKGYDGPVRNRSTGNLLEEFKRKKVELNTRDRRRLEALYDAEVTYHDRHFGHFLDGLNKLGVLNDTAIIVCSDHGEEFFEHESVGHGHTLHQELLHVPLCIRAPGVVPAGKRLTNDVGLGDILPTLMATNGVPPVKEIEGADLTPVIRGAIPDPLGAAFSSFFSEADDRNLSWTVRKGDFKLRMKGPARTYLYNLASDPREKNDVDTKYPLALRALRISLGQFIAAPNKHAWHSSQIAAQAVSAPGKKEEEAEMPDDLKAQLRALGYMQ